MIIRIRSESGQYRIEIDGDSGTMADLYTETSKILSLSDKTNFVLSITNTSTNRGKSTDGIGSHNEARISTSPLPNDLTKVNDTLTNGQIVLLHILNDTKEKPVANKEFKIHQIDQYLLKQKGITKRDRNPQFCKHGDQGMCEYCLPLQPYDKSYLDEQKIKHMSFHAHLRQIVDKNNLPAAHDPLFIPPLEVPRYTILNPCPSAHPPYPASICSACQPSAITLQTQEFRMVDHLEFEAPSIIENFIQFWRGSGNQRVGYLYGRYESYDKVPLGVKAVVSVIYEPKQSSGQDYIQLGSTETNDSTKDIIASEEIDYEGDKMAESLASLLGLEIVGIIYTDLIDDGTGSGTVICKRHANSYSLASSEIIFSSNLQNRYPVVTPYSPTGQFGSRFITCVISGNKDSAIDISTFQVSNSAQAMARDEIIEASTNPSLMRINNSTTNYIPDVFFKYKNGYGIQVQESAKPTFPVEYLLITLTHGFPQTPTPRFNSSSDYIENRGTNFRIKDAGPEILNDYHFLLRIMQSGLLDESSFAHLIKLVEIGDFDGIVGFEGWKTLIVAFGGLDESLSWACRHCTFVNQGDDCQMCGLPNQ